MENVKEVSKPQATSCFAFVHTDPAVLPIVPLPFSRSLLRYVPADLTNVNAEVSEKSGYSKIDACTEEPSASTSQNDLQDTIVSLANSVGQADRN